MLFRRQLNSETVFRVVCSSFCVALGALFLALPLSRVQAQTILSCNPDFEPASGAFDFVHAEQAEVQVSDGARIDRIVYTRLPVFDEQDPDEDNWLFRWANDFHLLTRRETISQQLLIAEDDEYRQRAVAESARILRAQNFFSDAGIRPISQCGDNITVEVITRDNWSLTPNLSYDRFGGENTYSVGLRDSNLLGRGKLLSVGYGKDIDQQTSELQYKDPNVFGTRIRNSLTFVDGDEGDRAEFAVDLPFFSLNSRRSWALRLSDEENQDEQFLRGEEVSAVRHDEKDYSVELGFSSGLLESIARRWRYGIRYQSRDFSPAPGFAPPAPFPGDRELLYPYVSYDYIEDGYTTIFNLNQIYRTEDLQTGLEWSVGVGYADAAVGSDRSSWILRSRFRDTLGYDADSLWQHSAELEAFFNVDDNEPEDVLLRYETQYLRRLSENRSFVARFQAEYSYNLSSHRQVVLGGFTGARAFDNNFQVGDRKVLLTLENRLYTDIHLLNLLRLGGVVFLDTGRAWEPGIDDGLEDDWLSNIGIGLRFASSKASSRRVAHLDFAFPLTNRDDPAVNQVMIAFTVKSSF